MEMIGDFMMQVNSGEQGSSEGNVPSSPMSAGMMNSMMTMNMWQELLQGIKEDKVISDVLTSQYDLIHGQSLRPRDGS